ncbi:MAG: hypothetical protein EOO87_04435 [Pedobacter sp.]|nr:MAG: hypothetical protein EOO87_04435 [Pedobacter sp.]
MKNSIISLFSKTLNFLRTKESKHPIINDIFESTYIKYSGYTMIPKDIYIDNLKLCIQFNNIDGDVYECGVWKGGMIAGLATILKDTRTYYLLDSFEGLPEVKDIDGTNAKKWQLNTKGEFYHDNCRAKMEFAKELMKSTKVNFHLIKGWFNITLPTLKVKKPIAILRLDGDWYDSTIDCLKYLYPKVAKDGLIIIDDYFAWDGCSRAVHDYLSSIKSLSRLRITDAGVCYIIKNDPFE